MPAINVSFFNNYYPTVPLYGITTLLNSDSPLGNIAIMSVINRQFSVIRDCSKTVTVVTYGFDETLSTRISFGITSLSSFNGNLSLEGFLDKNNPLIDLFNNLPNFFKDLKED
jgi:hypothetical protein